METLKNALFSIKKLFEKDKFLIILSLMFFVPLIFWWGKFGGPVVDCGREAYIPYAMGFLDKILFKDIICIYGPVPYYINALVVRILGPFGQNLNAFYFIGAILSYIFLIMFYKLAKRLLGAVLALFLSGVILFSCIFSPLISNFIFPYSYAIVYALVFAVLHLYFLINFIDDKNPKNLVFAGLFLVLCIFSKYDFAPCALVMLLLMIYYRKNIGLKGFLHVLLASFIVPVALLGIFILQKVTLSDIIFNFKMMSNMAKSPSLQYFYFFYTGFYFDFKKTFMFLGQFLASASILLVVCVLANFTERIKNKYFSFSAKIFICLIGAILVAALFFRYIFLYIPPIVLIFALVWGIRFLFKTLKTRTITASSDDIKIFTIILFSILFSLKSLFGLLLELYGVFYLPLSLFSFYLMWFVIFKTRKTLAQKASSALCTLSLTLIILYLIQNFQIFTYVKNYPVKSPSGTIFTTLPVANSMNNAINYLQKKPEKSLLVLPEGLLFNFLLKKESPYFNTSFSPLDFDAYGEKYLIEQFLANMPDYILLLDRSYDDYGKTFICSDFGLQFCSIINNRYTFARSFTENASDSDAQYRIYLFERNEND